MDVADPPWLGLVAVFALVGANGFFVAAEFALVKVRATRVEQLVLQGNAVARILQRQTAHLDSYIAATQLGITLASLALGWIGELALAHLIEPLVGWVGTTAAATAVANSVASAVSFPLITGFHIVLGELVPKSVALQRTAQVALFVVAPLRLFACVFRPFITLLNGAGNAVVRLLASRPSARRGRCTRSRSWSCWWPRAARRACWTWRRRCCCATSSTLATSGLRT